jgi:hypothetical protein
LEGHLEQEIAEEEDAGAEAEHGRREAEILVHGQRRETDVHAVDEGNEVQEHDERDDAQRDLAQYARFQFGTHWTVSSPVVVVVLCGSLHQRPQRRQRQSARVYSKN